MKLVVNVFGERRHFVIPKEARKTTRLMKGDYVIYRVLERNDEPIAEYLQIPIVGKAMISGLTSITMSMYPAFKELVGIQPGDRLLIDVLSVIKKEGDKMEVIWRDDRKDSGRNT